MKQLLVLAPQSNLADAIRALLDPRRYRVLWQSELADAEALFQQGAVDVCVIDADLTSVQPIRLLTALRSLAPLVPALIYASQKQAEWEEEALLLGAVDILGKPVRARVLNSILERCLNPTAALHEPGPPPTAVTPHPQSAPLA